MMENPLIYFIIFMLKYAAVFFIGMVFGMYIQLSWDRIVMMKAKKIVREHKHG
jgi:hypothetical protein